ncbi:MAG: beta-ribofuranosylaminobenzene 5'-phosphate synthase family protein [Halobacteriales archaeon]|nr:beta-ribofuranosylaminobenzene 5'-phosphate synthase family protein [Halobacteriales archaeon]
MTDTATSTKVRVETPARLHFGFLDLSGASGRLYGGVGVGIDKPRAVFEAEPAPTVDVVGADDETDYFERLVSEAVDTLGVEGARVEVVESLPRHVGLGSGTQHASAVLEAVARVNSFEDINSVAATREHVRSLGRGVRSGVGRAVFESGGFVVDAGHEAETPPEERVVPRVAVRQDLPSDWRFVVAVPEGRGAHGEDEERSMRRVVGDDEEVARRVREKFVAHVLPGAAEGDISSFGAGIKEFDRLNGVWYAGSGEQDDIYNQASAGVVECLQNDERVAGAGQSSWGPSVYALTTRENAEEVAESVDTRTFVAAPDNTGARLSLLP